MSDRVMRRCEVDGCGRKHCALGLCGTHYAQQRRGQPIHEPLRRGVHRNPICAAPGCERLTHSRGLCQGHWAQRRQGRPLTPLRAYGRWVDGHKVCPQCKRNLPADDYGMRNQTNRYTWCRSCANDISTARKYGLSVEVIRSIRAGKCEICGAPSPFVDHCHASGVVRGALCVGCNTALGAAKDDPAILRALADYLEQPRQIRLVVA